MRNVVITGAARTPMGGFQGAFQGLTAAELGGSAIKAALGTTDPAEVQELLMGCVLPAGQGQVPARQAGFKAGLSEEVFAVVRERHVGNTRNRSQLSTGGHIGGTHGGVIGASGGRQHVEAPR